MQNELSGLLLDTRDGLVHCLLQGAVDALGREWIVTRCRRAVPAFGTTHQGIDQSQFDGCLRSITCAACRKDVLDVNAIVVNAVLQEGTRN